MISKQTNKQKPNRLILRHFFSKHLLRTYYVPGIVSAGDTVVNKIGKLWILRELTVGREDRWWISNYRWGTNFEWQFLNATWMCVRGKQTSLGSQGWLPEEMMLKLRLEAWVGVSWMKGRERSVIERGDSTYEKWNWDRAWPIRETESSLLKVTESVVVPLSTRDMF